MADSSRLLELLVRKAAIVLIALGALMAAAVPAWAQYPPEQPTCAVDQSVVEPGDSIQVSGDNWQEDASVQVRFRQGQLDQVFGPFDTDGDGSFSGSVTIPASAQDGPARLVVGGPNQAGERVRCIVQLTVDSDGGPPPDPDGLFCAIDDVTPAPAQTVKVTGRQWQPRTEVEITFEQGASSQPMGTANVNGAGRFGKSQQIPADAEDGPAEVVVTGLDREGNPATCRIDITVTSGSASSAGYELAPPVNPANLGLLVVALVSIALLRRRRTRALVAAR